MRLAILLTCSSIALLLACRDPAPQRARAAPPSEPAPAGAWTEPDAARLAGLVEQGEEVWADLGCDACHGASRTATSGPPLAGIFGTDVKLVDGRSVHRDERYLLRAIDTPMADLVAGYEATMILEQVPDEEETLALVCYIRSLSAPARSSGTPPE